MWYLGWRALHAGHIFYGFGTRTAYSNFIAGKIWIIKDLRMEKQARAWTQHRNCYPYWETGRSVAFTSMIYCCCRRWWRCLIFRQSCLEAEIFEAISRQLKKNGLQDRTWRVRYAVRYDWLGWLETVDPTVLTDRINRHGKIRRKIRLCRG